MITTAGRGNRLLKEHFRKVATMPHDKNENLVKVGDKVTIEGEVVSISAGEDYCNCSVKIADGNGVGKETNITLNTHGCTVVQ